MVQPDDVDRILGEVNIHCIYARLLPILTYKSSWRRNGQVGKGDPNMFKGGINKVIIKRSSLDPT